MLQQESRKHKRLMKRAGQLDWDDLREIAAMKGMTTLEGPREPTPGPHEVDGAGDSVAAAEPTELAMENPRDSEAVPESHHSGDEAERVDGE